jgi:hypothetical protein
MVSVVLVLLGLFLTGYCIVTLERGVGQIVAGGCLLVLSLTAAVVPLSNAPSAAPAAPPAPAPAFTLQVSGR